MNIGKKFIFTAASLLAMTSTAMAQTSPVRPAYSFPEASESTGPRSIQLGNSPVYAAPFASLGVGHDSNVSLAPSGEISTSYSVLGLGAILEARDANSVFLGRVSTTTGSFSSSNVGGYTDAYVGGTYDVAFSRRAFARVSWDYLRGHDPLGSTDRLFVSTDPDKFYASKPGLVFAFGTPGAQGRIETFASREMKRYRNNRDSTEGSDRNTTDYGAAFYWRVAPKTHILAEARGTDIHYLLSSAALDSMETRYYGGVTWEATALTSGTIKVGRLEKRFDDSSRPKFRGSSWEGIVTWKPRTYSSFDLYSSRQTKETTGLGDFILTEGTGIIWTHSWNSFFSTEASARFQKDQYKGFNRSDDTTGIGLKANYSFRRWLTLAAEVQRVKRDSSRNEFDYDRNLYLISAGMSM